MNSLASIHPDAKIGKNVKVDPFAVIHSGAVIGDDTWIASGVTIFPGARIGKNCKIFPGAVIAAIPQDLKYKGENTVAIIGDNTTVRECVTINIGTEAAGKTEIGSNCLLMAYVHVAHDCIIGNHVIIANSVNLAGHVTIDDWAILEGGAAVSQFIRIGIHSFIAGMSGVRKDVPPFVKAAREPLSFMGINSVGLKRRGFADEKILEIEEAYRIIFQKGYNMQRALEEVRAEFSGSENIDNILQFISTSERGVIRGFNTLSAGQES